MIFPSAFTQLLSASRLVPFDSDASPTTATTCSSPPRAVRAAAMPSATEIATPAWPATAASARDSAGLGKPEMPSSRRKVSKRSARPVRIFHAYAWWPTSQTMRSFSGSNVCASAIASSTAPSDEARCPPLRETAARMRLRISSAVIIPPPPFA